MSGIVGERVQKAAQAGVAAILLAGTGYLGTRHLNRPQVGEITPIGPSAEAPPTEVVVHITGAVGAPGVYKFEPGTRLGEAIQRAKPWSNADLDEWNLAAKLEDGSKVVIAKKPAKSAAKPASQPTAIPRSGTRVAGTGMRPPRIDGNLAPLPLAAPEGYRSEIQPLMSGGAEPKRTTAKKVPPSSPISINDASGAELQRIPGIGPSMAQRILAYRRERGGFSSIEELMEVRGIGEKTLAKMRPYVKL